VLRVVCRPVITTKESVLKLFDTFLFLHKSFHVMSCHPSVKPCEKLESIYLEGHEGDSFKWELQNRL
jgi:hypothetical protein